jgi:hypothetical protein
VTEGELGFVATVDMDVGDTAVPAALDIVVLHVLDVPCTPVFEAVVAVAHAAVAVAHTVAAARAVAHAAQILVVGGTAAVAHVPVVEGMDTIEVEAVGERSLVAVGSMLVVEGSMTVAEDQRGKRQAG